MLKEICDKYGVNEEQAKALDIDKSIALRAGAGSGKTRVLTKRFVRLLLDNPTLSLDSIAAITFTKKAAAEMKDRIRRELSEAIGKISDQGERKRLLNLKMMISNANIDTIHGFCSKLLRDNFTVLGLDPAFEVMEEVDKKVRLSKIADAVIFAFLEQPENIETIKIINGSYSLDIFTGELKQGIISAYNSIREKGYVPFDTLKIGLDAGNDETDPVKVLKRLGGRLVLGLDNSYKIYKAKENLLDFNDLEILTEELLRDENIKSSYFKRYKYIMVDEFQDVNPLQKKILDHLTLKDERLVQGRLFIVGDHKQSIYGFRGSDYRVFEEACEKITTYGKLEHLNNCYRSTENIINTVNSVFSQLLSPYERLEYPGKHRDSDKKVELITWEKSALKDSKPKTRWDIVSKLLTEENSAERLKAALYDEYSDDVTAGKKDYQGDIISGTVKRLIDDGFLYRDIAILLRSRSSLAEIESSLIKNSIPFCVLGGIGFWDRQEVSDILSLYKLIFYPEDWLSFAESLRSPVFGFSDDLLLALSIYKKKADTRQLDKLLYGFSKEVSANEVWLAERAADVLKELLPLDGVQNALNLLKDIISITAYDEILALLPQGEKKLRNLEKLLRIAEDFEAKGIYSARELIQYLEVLKESSGMDGEAFLDNEDSDAVKILTIHASKGLEFGAVIIPDMDRALDSQIKKNKPLFFVDEQAGLIAVGLDDDLKIKEDANPEYSRRFSEKLLRELEDSRRLFYVAATRAKDYLAFIGEKQEAAGEELIMQNTFMKQLVWAMDRTGTIEEIVFVNAMDYTANEQRQNVYPLAFTDEFKKLPVQEDKTSPNLVPCQEECSGSISISSWMKYRDCPRHFFLENLAGLTQKEQLTDFEEQNEDNGLLSAADFGTLLHAFLEEIDISKIDSIKAEDFTGAAVALETGLVQADKELFQRSVKGFLKIEEEQKKVNRGKLITSLKEFGFRVPIKEDLNLTGFIDRIDIYESDSGLHATIIDYKTNRVEDESDLLNKLEYYKNQLLSYAWALSQLDFYEGKQIVVSEAKLYFLYKGEALSISIDSKSMTRMLKELQDSASWLLGSNSLREYKYQKSEKCGWCSSRKYCEALS